MTLSGNLGFVPLDEVLRLLTRSGNTGVVEITNGNVSGRIFVAGEGIGLATTFRDEELERHILSSGYLASDSVGAESVPFNDDLISLIREMTVESIYQMDGDDADFQVVRDTWSRYSAPDSFDLEKVLDDSRKRAEEWDKVLKKIPDLDAEMKINRGLKQDSVQLDRESWRLISEIGGGASVRDLSASLGTTDYAVASVAASMVGDDLLVIEGAAVPVEEHYEVDEDHGLALEEAAGADTDEAEIDPDRSWWDEPETEDSAVDEAPEAGHDQADHEEHDETEPAASGEDSGSEEDDTDAFLEKVFSEVGSEPVEEDGHGLMRRRRMGSILRELGED